VQQNEEFNRWARLLFERMVRPAQTGPAQIDWGNPGATDVWAGPTPSFRTLATADIPAAIARRGPGVDDRAESTLSFNEGTRVFTIAPAATSFTFVSNATVYTKSSAQTVTISDTEGLWFVYFNDAGTLTATQTYSDNLILRWAIVALIYWDATNNVAVFVGDERHGNVMDGATHLYLHNSRKTVLDSTGGLTLGDIDADALGNANSHAQFSVAGGTIWDEDIKFSISALSAPAQIPIFYRSGATAWRKKTADNFPLIYANPGTRASYNQNNAGSWQLTEVANQDFVLMHYFAVGAISGTPRVIGICGQADYATLAAAQAGAETEIADLQLSGLPVVEFVALATVIFQTADNYSNTPKARIRATDTGADYIDWRNLKVQGSAGTGGTGTTVWGAIGGTLADQADLQAALDAIVYDTATAGEALGGHRFVVLNDSGEAIYATNQTANHAHKIFGMTTGAANLAATATIQRQGAITEPSWNWTLNSPIFLSTSGQMTQTPPATGFSLIVGFPLSATSMYIAIREPITLV
jgi:hypothetical protein